MEKKYNIVFEAKMALGEMKTGISQMQSMLENGFKKVNVPENVASSLLTQIKKMGKEAEELGIKTSQGFSSMSDVSKAETSLKKLMGLYGSLKDKFEELKLNPEKLIPSETTAKINKLQQAYEKTKIAIDNMVASEAKTKGLEEDIAKAEEKTRQYTEAIRAAKDEKKKLTDSKISLENDFETAKKGAQEVEEQIKKIKGEIDRLNNQKTSNYLGNYTEYKKQYNNYTKDIKKLESEIAILQSKKKSKTEIISPAEIDRLKKAKQELADLVSKRAELRKEAQEVGYSSKEQAGKKDKEANTNTAEQIKKQEQALKDAQEQQKGWASEVANTERALKQNGKSIEEYDQKINGNTEKLNENNEKLKELKQNLANVGVTTTEEQLEKLKQKFQEAGVSIEQLSKATTLEDFNNIIANIKTEKLEEVRPVLEQMGLSLQQVDGNVRLVSSSLEENRQSVERTDAAYRDVDALKQRITYFFGLNNAINLARRALRNAFNTIKELDKTMTETAVVTDFSVGDMWEQLPEYTKRANELGVATNDVYGAATLYYQQGLKTNEVMAISNETLKMARIAGIEAAEATDYMTAALRGFNMELNETSAQRINDVYSKLASITASNTQEISVAMTKVASLANNANMEFETTAAFLSQIVETTRESAETAGTALKTVIARFSEVKQLYSEGELMGTDEEGMEIDVNKISTALRTAGINLNEYFMGMKGLDEIFLELAQKWDSLTSVQQRYIATQAAGSRQQSRFIAMMSNYDRTVELVNAANNSAGASQEQFNKTLESMETLLAKLKNAWNEFTMGIANNEILKTGIRILTSFLNILNDITNILPGMASGFAKIALAWAGLKAGRAIFNSLLSSFGKAGKEGAISFRQSFQQEFGGKKGIFSIISKEIFANKTDKYYAKLTPAINKYIASEKKAAAAQAASISVRKTGIGVDILSEKAAAASAAAERDRAEAISLLSAYYGLENTQAEQALAITTLGINSDIAAAAAKNNLTKEMVEEMIAAEINAGATREEAAAKVESTLAERYADSIRKKSLLSRLAAIIHTKAQTIANKAEEGSLWKKVAALIAEKTAQDASNASKLFALGIIGLIIAAIIALIALIVTLIKAMANSTPTARLEQAKEAAEEAGKAAEEAAESFNTLKESLDGLAEKYKSLEDLTRGTREWRQALIETNNAVLDLIEKYPELASLVANKDGVLTIEIDSPKVQKVLDDYEDRQFKAESANYKAQINVLEKQVDVEYSDLEWKVQKTRPKGNRRRRGNTIIEDRELTEELAIGLAKGEITKDGVSGTQSIDKFLEGTSFSFNATEESVAALKEFGNTLLEADNKMGMFNSAIADNALAMLDQTKYSNEQTQQMSNFLNSDRIEKMTQNKLDELPDKYDDFSVEQKKAYEKFFKDTYGEDVEIGSDGKVIYKDENDKEVTIDSDIARELYAAAEATEDAADAAEKFSNALPKMSKSAQKIYTKGEGGALTLEDLSNLTGENDYNKILAEIKNKSEVDFGDENSAFYDKAKDEWEKLGKEGQSVYSDFAEFQQEYVEAIQLSAERFNGYLKKLDPSIQAKVRQYDSEIVKNLSIQIAGMGDEEAKNYVSNFNKVLEKSNLGEEAKKSLESYLSTVDWSNMTQAIEAMDYMQELGIDQSIIESYWNAAVEGANTYIHSLEEASKLTERFQGKMSSATEMKERLIEGKGTAEDIAALEEAGVDLTGKLKLAAEGWQMTEEAAEEATKAIYQNTAKQAQAALEAHQKQMEDYSKMGDETVTLEAFGPQLPGQPPSTLSYSFSELIGLTEEDGKYTAKNFNELSSYTKEWIAQRRDINREDYETDEEYWTAAEGAYNDYIDALNNGEARTEMMQQTADFTAAIAYSTDENALMGASDEAVRYAMQNEAVAQGLDSADVTAYADSLFNEKSYGLSQQMADRIAIDNARLQKGVEDLTSSYDDLAVEIEAGIANPKYQTSVNQLKKITENLIGTTEGLSDSWFTNNKQMELFKRIAQGDLKAVDELRKSAAKEIIFGADFDEESLTEEQQTLLNMLDSFNPEDIVIGASLDSTGMTEAFNALIESGELTAEEVSRALENIGYEPEITYKEVPVNQVNYGKQTGTAEVINPVTGQRTTVTAENISEFAQNGMVKIPVINGSNTKFKGSAPKVAAPTTNSSGGGGGGSKEEWENPYDWLYNLTEKINNKLREREKLERRYNKLVEGRKATTAQLLATSDLELKNLESQNKLQSEMLAKRKEEMKKELGEYSDMSKYASYDFETGLIQINWDLIDSVTDTEEGERIEEYISKLEEIRDEMQNAEDALDDIEDQIDEINERGKDEYTSLEEKIKDAIINSRQEEIDRLSAINDTINDTNSKLIDSMQKAIDQQRQDRENEKTEEEIAEKQRRLVYLQQDTSGANALEILKLQDEISESQESYTDQLIDQKISELQKQNDAAAEQRERQIEILQAQLEYDEKYGEIAKEVKTYIDEVRDNGGTIFENSKLAELLMKNDGFQSLTDFAKAEWWADIQSMASAGLAFFERQSAIYSGRDFSAEIKEALSKGDYELAAELEQLRNYKIDFFGLDEQKTYSYSTGDWSQWGAQPPSKPEPPAPAEPQTPPPPSTPTVSESDKKKVAAAIWRGGLGWGSGTERSNKLTEVFGSNNGIQNMVNQGIGKNDGSDLSEYTYTKMRKKYKGYKTGGLADYTGPAWLDGTPSKPEIILNQKDSQNFIELKDILSSLMGYSSKRKAESNGDNYYDIDINVESIGSDYDVERAADKIKSMIRDDAMYRNVNAINNMR